MLSRRSPGETSEPVEATSSRGHVPGKVRYVAAAGVSARRPASLHPTLRNPSS